MGIGLLVNLELVVLICSTFSLVKLADSPNQLSKVLHILQISHNLKHQTLKFWSQTCDVVHETKQLTRDNVCIIIIWMY